MTTTTTRTAWRNNDEFYEDGRRSFKVISVGILSSLYFLLHHFAELNERIILFPIRRRRRSRMKRKGGGAHYEGELLQPFMLGFKKTFCPNVSLALSYMFFSSPLIQRCLSSIHEVVMFIIKCYEMNISADMLWTQTGDTNYQSQSTGTNLMVSNNWKCSPAFLPFHDLNSDEVETSYSFNKEKPRELNRKIFTKLFFYVFSPSSWIILIFFLLLCWGFRLIFNAHPLHAFLSIHSTYYWTSCSEFEQKKNK